jgi:hypothetical protein
VTDAANLFAVDGRLHERILRIPHPGPLATALASIAAGRSVAVVGGMGSGRRVLIDTLDEEAPSRSSRTPVWATPDREAHLSEEVSNATRLAQLLVELDRRGVDPGELVLADAWLAAWRNLPPECGTAFARLASECAAVFAVGIDAFPGEERADGRPEDLPVFRGASWTFIRVDKQPLTPSEAVDWLRSVTTAVGETLLQAEIDVILKVATMRGPIVPYGFAPDLRQDAYAPALLASAAAAYWEARTGSNTHPDMGRLAEVRDHIWARSVLAPTRKHTRPS